MSCNVCIGTSDYDGPEFYVLEIRLSRKPHGCRECSRTIERGELYEHVSAKWDGSPATVNTCRQCAEIRNVFSCGEGYVHGRLWENMTEVAFPQLTTATDCFRELSSEGKAFLLDKWRKWKFAQV